ncbi:MAG: hypothetical protein ABSG83_13870 [Roseiarcus sp.]|jgi:hypothetical protein
MPTFDAGHYFLTCLVPVLTGPIREAGVETSPAQALRKRLACLPTAAQTPERGGGRSPFARNARTHFARLVVIDDVAYNGRDLRDTLWSAARRDTLTLAQPQDHLTCPFLLFAVDFDAASGADGERDSYLAELWRTAEPELRGVFGLCRGFAEAVTDERSFAAYLARGQLETTMSFNDYYVDPPNLPVWATGRFKWAAIASAAAFALGLAATLALFVAELFGRPMVSELRWAVGLTVLGAAALALVGAAAYASVMAAGARPFPAAPDADLPTVLEALHLQRRFTRFAIDRQGQAAADDAASAQRLYDEFGRFIAENRPGEPDAARQAPGVIGI